VGRLKDVAGAVGGAVVDADQLMGQAGIVQGGLMRLISSSMWSRSL
jgi:hypothetical protein